MCFYAVHFRDPNHLSRRPILARNVYFGATQRPQLQCRRAHFPHSYTQWFSQEKMPSFSFVPNSSQIWHSVQNGEKSNLPRYCTVFELRRHATKVRLDESSWIFHTIFCCQFPLCSLGNTLPPPPFFWEEHSDFLTLVYLATSHRNLAPMSCTCFFVWGRRYPPPSTPNMLSVRLSSVRLSVVCHRCIGLNGRL